MFLKNVCSSIVNLLIWTETVPMKVKAVYQENICISISKCLFWYKSFCNSHIKCLFLSYFKLLFTVYICAVCLMVFLLSVCSLFHLKVKSEQKSTHFLKTWVSITKTLEMRRSLNNSEKAPTLLLPKQMKSHNQKRKRTNFNLNFSLYFFCFPLWMSLF